jgi:hypothetical protein
MKGKLIVFLLLVVLAGSITFEVVNAQTNYVSGSISANTSTIVVHDSVTFTCTYTSTIGVTGTGSLEMSAPASSASGPFKNNDEIYSWSTLSSGVPVTYTQQIDAAGYYRVRWLCSGGGVDGAYTLVIIHVLDAPSVLPEAPPLAVFALGFAALGLFVAVTKKRTKQ